MAAYKSMKVHTAYNFFFNKILVIINWDDAECVLYSILHKRGSLVATAIILMNKQKMLSLCVAQGDHLVRKHWPPTCWIFCQLQNYLQKFSTFCAWKQFLFLWRILITFYLFCAIILISELLKLLDPSGICVNCPEAGCSVVFSNVLWLCQMFTVKLILSGDGVQDCGVSDAVSQGFLSPLQLVSTVSGLSAWLTQPDSLLLSSTSTNLSSLHYRLLLLIS